GPPVEQPALQPRRQRDEDHRYHAERDEGHEEIRRLELTESHRDDVAESLRAADELAHDHADDRGRHGERQHRERPARHWGTTTVRSSWMRFAPRMRHAWTTAG